jgi:hypothetical protein
VRRLVVIAVAAVLAFPAVTWADQPSIQQYTEQAPSASGTATEPSIQQYTEQAPGAAGSNGPSNPSATADASSGSGFGGKLVLVLAVIAIAALTAWGLRWRAQARRSAG